jgi:hypothetical protein
MEVTGKMVLMLQMQPNDANAETVRDYLIRLLILVWRDGEGFDGKRPFGNSGWEHELFTTLAKAGLIQSSSDEFDYYDFDRSAGRDLIELAINELG